MAITAAMYNGAKGTFRITAKKAPTSVALKAGKTFNGKTAPSSRELETIKS